MHTADRKQDGCKLFYSSWYGPDDGYQAETGRLVINSLLDLPPRSVWLLQALLLIPNTLRLATPCMHRHRPEVSRTLRSSGPAARLVVAYTINFLDDCINCIAAYLRTALNLGMLCIIMHTACCKSSEAP
jgi:hypothetical protein